ncbi:alpha/beta-Hydrolases superfamily protein [Euphorbia peplus]|nr:alpha/beta-Hydrolases superfamily protein [Euphorbia peplus]
MDQAQILSAPVMRIFVVFIDTFAPANVYSCSKEQSKHCCVDNIVNDAEFIRVILVPDAGPWTVLGQSYGGFCAVTYLSFAPKGFLVEIVREVVNHLALLPSRGLLKLTPRGLRLLGLSGLGASAGFERLHYLLERVWNPVILPGSQKRINYYFLKAFERWLDFDSNPLYPLMQSPYTVRVLHHGGLLTESCLKTMVSLMQSLLQKKDAQYFSQMDVKCWILFDW